MSNVSKRLYNVPCFCCCSKYLWLSVANFAAHYQTTTGAPALSSTLLLRSVTLRNRLLSSQTTSTTAIQSKSQHTNNDAQLEDAVFENNNNNNNSDQQLVAPKKQTVPANFWKDMKNVRAFFDNLAPEFGITSDNLDKWQEVSIKQVHQRGGMGLLKRYYGGSLMRALKAAYPEHKWKPNRVTSCCGDGEGQDHNTSSSTPSGFWKDPTNHRRFLDKLMAADELNLKHLDDWYNVSAKDVRARGGGGMLSYYNGSLVRALLAVYPEHPWRLTRFAKVPQNFWKDLANQRRFFDEIGQDLGVRHLDDWYSIRCEDVQAKGASGLLSAHYGSSLMRALRAVYPEHPWNEAPARVPTNHWKSPDNHRQFFDKIARELGLARHEDWYNVTSEEVTSRGGGFMLAEYYGGSLVRALASVYPEFAWDPVRFANVPRGFWKDLANQRRFFDVIGQELGVKHLDDWYRVSTADIVSRGGSGIVFRYYGGSIVRALRAIYPEHPWQTWRFPRRKSTTTTTTDSSSHASRNSGSNNSNSNSNSDTDAELEGLLAEVAAELGVQHLDDWYRVSMTHLRRLPGYRYIKHNGGLVLVLKRVYPEHPWDEKKLSSISKRSSQRRLLNAIQKLFPNEEIMEDYLHSGLVFAGSNQKMELDLYIPSLSLAFEYQGEQHFNDLQVFGPHAHYYERHDNEKVLACKRIGVTLVTVPYWWDGTAESVAAAIQQLRPDLAPSIQSK